MKHTRLLIMAGLISLVSTTRLSAVSVIEGYMEEQSYVAGETMRFYVSTNSPTFSIELIRVGTPDQVVASASGIPGESHIDGWSAAKQYWLDARWTVSHEWVVPESWPTGAYFAKFIHESGDFSYFPFVIRQPIPGSLSRIAYVANYNTDCAYNTWGGASLYASTILPIGRSISVGFQRPIMDYDGRGKFFPVRNATHRTLEEEGYTLEYITERDLHYNPTLHRAYDVLVLAGHHEYVTWEIFDALEEHRNMGKHLVILSANDFYWQVRFEGDDGRVMVCYKALHSQDPMNGVQDHLVTGHFYDPPVNRDPAALQGIRYTGALNTTYEPEQFLVQIPSHFIFDGLDVEMNEPIGDTLARSETDYLATGSPPILDIVLYARRMRIPADKVACPTWSPYSVRWDQLCRTTPENPCACGRADVEYHDAAAIFYEHGPDYGFPEGRGGQVFSAGSEAGWCKALLSTSSDYQRVRRMTRNIIDHMLEAPRDCNSNGVEDSIDIADCLPGDLACADCNANGVPDSCDMFNCPMGITVCADCNANGILDGCEEDCNGNLIPDDCDIADCGRGVMSCRDCNTNGIPDGCDLVACDPQDPDCGDCNGNGIPDSCDIAGCATSKPECKDCDENGVPDGCDPDCNGNLIADACDIADCLPGDMSCTDCNLNVIPDGCEADFDGDGIIDVCDDDIDEDAVANSPDVCDFTPLGHVVGTDGRSKADIDLDCAVTLGDFAALQRCFTGPGPVSLPSACESADFDGDQDVDLDDFNLVLSSLGGM